MTDGADPRVAFIEAATWHGSLERAEEILTAHPELRSSDIHTAAILGDDAAVRRFLAPDPANATLKSEPYGGDALNYLCLSKYLRLDPTRSQGFLRAATALLDAGADPNTGFWTKGQHPERETALYGAAGVAHHPEMTRLLLVRGADPTDEEAVYHSPETYDNDAMKLLVETGRLSPDDLALMLIRKHDWHDYDGAKWLLEHGADPNPKRGRGWRAIHHALARDNSLAMIALLLDHGADPALAEDGVTAVARAAREGRSDVLELFEQRGVPIELRGVDRLIAACAKGDAEAVRSLADREPHLVGEVRAMGGGLLAKFAGTDNPPGVRQLLDLGVDVAAPFTEGDGYHDEPKGSLAIHVAAWRARPAVVKLLIERGSPIDPPDAKGRTPLALAVRACVDSYWTERCSPESIQALLGAGAKVEAVPFPSGHPEIDDLLEKHHPTRTGENPMKLRSLVIAGSVLLSAESSLAQSGGGAAADPISGTWTGDLGLTLTERYPIKFELKFDGAAAITGTVTGPGPAEFKTGTFDPTTGALRLEVDVKDNTGARRFVFEGTAVNGTATGRVTDGPRTGSFRITKSGGEPAAGQQPGDDAAAAMRKSFAEVSGWVTKAVDLVPADKYSYRPAPTVRTFGQLIGHVADSYNYYCARAAGRNLQWSAPIEKGNTDKATLVPKLKQALEGCNAAYAGAGQVGALTDNVAHTSLHYGNIITYMRMLGMVPPSS